MRAAAANYYTSSSLASCYCMVATMVSQLASAEWCGSSRAIFPAHIDLYLESALKPLGARSTMGSWWRSEEMTYMSLILSEDAAPACIRELGTISL